ncbi:hypothetical protein GQ42DRAFT_162105 [Ramicandelaber brevisporus]|nr:hypothetical protein GQ42DRAFT_162105 [Ramicandelaber brevisporus]
MNSFKTMRIFASSLQPRLLLLPRRNTHAIAHSQRRLASSGSGRAAVQPVLTRSQRDALAIVFRRAAYASARFHQQQPGSAATPAPSSAGFHTTMHVSEQFDTFKMVKSLQTNNVFTHGQAVAIMRCVEALLRDRTASVSSQLLTKPELDNDAYLFTAALAELRFESQTQRRNDHASMRFDLDQLNRDVDTLSQRLREEIAALKSDIQIEMNNHRNDARDSLGRIEMEMYGLNNKFTVRLGEVKTEIEAMKWDTVQRAIVGLFGCVGSVMLITWVYRTFTHGPHMPEVSVVDVVESRSRSPMEIDQDIMR